MELWKGCYYLLEKNAYFGTDNLTDKILLSCIHVITYRQVVQPVGSSFGLCF